MFREAHIAAADGVQREIGRLMAEERIRLAAEAASTAVARAPSTPFHAARE
jgi:hypothetical protein